MSATRVRWTRYPRLWVRLLGMCYAHGPRTTLAAFACRLLGLVSLPATALALRLAVDAGSRASVDAGAARAAILTAIGVAVVYAVDRALEEMSWGYCVHLTDRVGLLALEVEIVRTVCDIETTDHLDRTDFLDRVTVLRGAAWQVMFSAWGAVDALVNAARLAIVLALLGTVSPYLLLLLVFGVVPLWFDARGRRVVLA